jgi:hypothetical protein
MVIMSDMENRPCIYTGQVVHTDNPDTGHWSNFKPAAAGLRGVTAWVEREGSVRVGDRVQLFVPDQRPWRHLEELSELDMNQGGEGASRSRGCVSALTAQLMGMMVAGMVCALVLGLVWTGSVR